MNDESAARRGKLDRRTCLHWAAGFTASGLVIETLSLNWSHPTAFLLFILGGGTLIGMGAVAYIWAMLLGEPS